MSKITHSINILRDLTEGDQNAQFQLDLIEQHYEEATNTKISMTTNQDVQLTLGDGVEVQQHSV